jgi:hypothetical protein
MGGATVFSNPSHLLSCKALLKPTYPPGSRHPAYHTTNPLLLLARLAITDEASPFALRSTRNRPRSHGRWPPRRMRMATPGQARLLLVRASPCPRLMRGPSRYHELFAASTRFSVVSWVGPAGCLSTGELVGGGRRGSWSWNGPRGWMSARMRWWPASGSLTCRRGSGSGTSPPGGPHLPDVHLQLGDSGGLAADRGRHPSGDGGPGQDWKPCW